jgi:tetratricopeptide (TPR) repeat protein
VSADRLTQTLTTAIQQSIRTTRVASFGLAAKYGGDQAHDPRRAGAELNVRYLVEGELRHADDVDAVDVRLVDATTGTQVWSRRLSSTPGTDSDGDMIARLSSSLGDALGRTESKRIADLPKSSTEAVDRLLRANALWRQNPSLKGTLAARPLYEEALRLDPSFAPALVGLGYTLYMQWTDDPNADRQDLARQIDDVSLRAIRVDPDDPNAWVLRTNALSMQGREKEALEANATALKIDPYLCASLHDGAAMLTAIGKPQDALSLLERALGVYGYGEAMQTTSLYACRAHLALGNYGGAIRTCETAGAHGLDWWYLQLLLSAAYAQSGFMEKALAAKARLFEQRPDMSIERFRTLTTSTNPTYLQQTEAHLVAGLRKAGVPSTDSIGFATAIRRRYIAGRNELTVRPTMYDGCSLRCPWATRRCREMRGQAPQARRILLHDSGAGNARVPPATAVSA